MHSRAFSSTFSFSEGKRLEGMAAVYNSPTKINERGRSFQEVIRPGAFSKALASGGDIIATWNHDSGHLLGRTSSGTLQLRDTPQGLAFSIDLPDTSTGNEVRELARRGDITGASFTFGVRQGGETWTDGTRELTDLYLAEIAAVAQPAYSSTHVALRSAVEDGLLEVLRLRLDLAQKIH